MMSSAELVWGETGTDTVTSATTLRESLQALHQQAKEQPDIAQLTLVNGDSLSIGLGRPGCVLTFAAGTGDPPYYISVGTPDGGPSPAGETDVVMYWYRGHWSEFPAFAVIPCDLAFDAMCEFFDTGRLAQTVTWTE